MIERVRIRNWKSHKESELEFDNGVNVLVGEMGSGKSSILEAIVFGLFGKTSAIKERKIGLDDLIRRSPNKAKEASVEVKFKADEKSYRVKRVVKRDKGTTEAKLYRKDELLAGPQTREVTEKVVKLLDLDFDLFTQVVYSEQNKLDFFLNLPPRKRKDRIDQLLNMDRFEKARSNAVTLSNRIKDRYRDKKKTVNELKEDFDQEKYEELEEDIKSLERKLENIEEKRGRGKDEKQELEDMIEELEDKKDKHEKHERKRTKFKTRIEDLGKKLSELEDEISLCLEELSSEKIEEMLETEVSEKLDQLEESKEEIQELEKNISRLKERKKRLDEAVEELSEKKEKAEKLGEVEEKVDEITEKVEERKEKRSEANADLGNIEDAIKELSQASEECPTCGKELDEEHRVKILKKKKKRKGELEKEIEELDEEIESLEDDLEGLNEKKEELLQYKNLEEELDEKKKDLEKVNEKLGSKKEKLDDLKNKFSDEKEEELKRRKEELEKGLKYFKKDKKLKEIKEELEKVNKELEELDFDEETLEELKEKLSSTKEKLGVLKNKKESKKEVLEEKRKRLEEFESKKERIGKLEEEVEKYDVLRDFGARFKRAITETQKEMRSRFVNRSNKVMQDVWATVYPYDDYSSIRLEAGDDYVLQLKDDRGSWVSVDEEVSGGERHSAALALRIALSIVLAPGFGVLILDEPTHNLDERAIQDLAETLRTNVVEFVDQLFLVTHDGELEAAVTGSLYNLSKKDTSHGLTKVEEDSL
ncbi:MAG: AAA family ATPase [Candidatus Nanohaloarchaeota archaeon QJJ-9]|nr:AAA family ATPase [Candidatus Nanohaloarchaeota archaeon QJJ-9]